MSLCTARTILVSPDATATLGARIGAALRPGDTLLLEGGIGAGKTHFARALIQSLQDTPEDVPSPSFTLVQEYDTRSGPLWHADLYRLGGRDDIAELGLEDAFETAIVLVEWPDRLEGLAPDDALTLGFEPGADPDARRVSLRWSAPRWAKLAERLG